MPGKLTSFMGFVL